MKKVTGYADYSVNITCPECEHEFDVIGTENDTDNAVTAPMFENTQKSCTNMNIDITYPNCEVEMTLDEIEY